MRIIGGKLKRKRFKPPKGFPSRPTTDFAKEGLFNVLENEFAFGDLKVLDLFSGTGNILFEFASREVGNITGIDKNYKCIRFINQFIKQHNLSDSVTIVKADVMDFLKKSSGKYDIIFADPPFDSTIHHQLVDTIFQLGCLTEYGTLILEHNKYISFKNHEKWYKIKEYGGVNMSFFTNNPS